MSESKNQYKQTTQKRANQKKNVNNDNNIPQISEESEKIIVDSAKNINKLADIQEDNIDDLKDIHNIMKKVVDKNQQLQHNTNEQLSKITHDFELALHKKGKSTSDISEVGNYIAKEIRSDIEKVIDSDQKISREELIAIEKQIPHLDHIIDSMDSVNDGEIKRAKELKKLLQNSINQRKQIDLNLPKLIGKEVGKQSLSGIESGFNNIESSFISAVSKDPLTAKMASGIFWLIKKGSSSVWDVWKKQKKHKEGIAERLRGTQEALAESQIETAKKLHDAESEHLVNIEKAVKESSKINLSPYNEEYKSPIEKIEPSKTTISDIEIDSDYIKNIALDVASINRRFELASQNDAEEALEKAERDDNLLDAINDLTNATKSQKDIKKKGLLKGIWNFISNIPTLLSGGIGAAITAALIKIKKSKIFTIFSNIGKWLKELNIGRKLSTIGKLIIKPFNVIETWLKGLNIGRKLSIIGKLIIKPFKMLGNIGKIILPIGKLVSKFGKMIPFVGQIITVIEGIFGFFNAKKILGKDTITIMDRFASAIGGIFEGFGEVADMLLGWFGFDTNIKTWLNENFTKPLAALFNMDLSEIWNNMTEYYSNLWSDLTIGIKDFFSDIFNWENLKENLVTVWNWTPFGIISNLAGNIFDFFAEKFSWENTLNGIKEFSEWNPIEVLTSFGKSVKNWFKDKFSFFGKKEKEIKIVSKPIKNNISNHKQKFSEFKPSFIKNNREEFLPDDNNNLKHLFNVTNSIDLNNIRPDLLPTEKFNINTDRPIEINSLKEQKDIDKINDISRNINISPTQNSISQSNSSPIAMTSCQSTPRDNDPHIQYMNQIFAP